jgi:hypothetical protein
MRTFEETSSENRDRWRLRRIRLRRRRHLGTVDITREPLLKGKEQYSGPPCTN